MAQGAGQSIESAFDLFELIKKENSEVQKLYFKKRLSKTKIVRSRSNFNYFIFHLSSGFLKNIRNFFMKFLLKKKKFINFYIGKVYSN